MSLKTDIRVKNGLRIFFGGFLFSALLSAVFLLILALIMYFSDIDGRYVSIIGSVLILLAIFAGAFYAGSKAKSHRTAFGGGIGLLCFTVLYLFAIEASDGKVFSAKTAVICIICILVGIIASLVPKSKSTVKIKKHTKKHKRSVKSGA